MQYIDVTTLNENRGHELGRGQGGVYKRVQKEEREWENDVIIL